MQIREETFRYAIGPDFNFQEFLKSFTDFVERSGLGILGETGSVSTFEFFTPTHRSGNRHTPSYCFILERGEPRDVDGYWWGMKPPYGLGHECTVFRNFFGNFSKTEQVLLYECAVDEVSIAGYLVEAMQYLAKKFGVQAEIQEKLQQASDVLAATPTTG